MKIIVSSSFVFKYVTEYLDTFDGYISTIYDNLFNYDLNNCEELILVQWEIWKWLPEHIFKLPLKISILNTEQLVFEPHKNNIVENIKNLELKCGYKVTIYDYSKTNCKILEDNGFTSKYHEYISTPTETVFLKSLLNTEKKYDIGFIGTPSERRNNILNSLKQSGITILLLDSWGKERDIELAKCKYILNIHWNDDYKIFESVRCNRWLQAGFKVISEESYDIFPSDNLFVTPYNELTNFIQDILNKS